MRARERVRVRLCLSSECLCWRVSLARPLARRLQRESYHARAQTTATTHTTTTSTSTATTRRRRRRRRLPAAHNHDDRDVVVVVQHHNSTAAAAARCASVRACVCVYRGRTCPSNRPRKNVEALVPGPGPGPHQAHAHLSGRGAARPPRVLGHQSSGAPNAQRHGKGRGIRKCFCETFFLSLSPSQRRPVVRFSRALVCVCVCF